MAAVEGKLVFGQLDDGGSRNIACQSPPTESFLCAAAISFIQAVTQPWPKRVIDRIARDWGYGPSIYPELSRSVALSA